MCLHTLSRFGTEEKIASSDMKVWKLLERNGIQGTFQTPYRNTKVVLGQRYTSPLVQNNIDNNRYDFGKPIISVGLHSFINNIDAYGCASQLKDYLSSRDCIVVAVCIIPAGTPYYSGLDDSGHECFASAVLVYPETVTQFNSKLSAMAVTYGNPTEDHERQMWRSMEF